MGSAAGKQFQSQKQVHVDELMKGINNHLEYYTNKYNLSKLELTPNLDKLLEKNENFIKFRSYFYDIMIPYNKEHGIKDIENYNKNLSSNDINIIYQTMIENSTKNPSVLKKLNLIFYIMNQNNSTTNDENDEDFASSLSESCKQNQVMEFSQEDDEFIIDNSDHNIFSKSNKRSEKLNKLNEKKGNQLVASNDDDDNSILSYCEEDDLEICDAEENEVDASSATVSVPHTARVSSNNPTNKFLSANESEKSKHSSTKSQSLVSRALVNMWKHEDEEQLRSLMQEDNFKSSISSNSSKGSNFSPIQKSSSSSVLSKAPSTMFSNITLSKPMSPNHYLKNERLSLLQQEKLVNLERNMKLEEEVGFLKHQLDLMEKFDQKNFFSENKYTDKIDSNSAKSYISKDPIKIDKNKKNLSMMSPKTNKKLEDTDTSSASIFSPKSNTSLSAITISTPLSNKSLIDSSSNSSLLLSTPDDSGPSKIQARRKLKSKVSTPMQSIEENTDLQINGLSANNKKSIWSSSNNSNSNKHKSIIDDDSSICSADSNYSLNSNNSKKKKAKNVSSNSGSKLHSKLTKSSSSKIVQADSDLDSDSSLNFIKGTKISSNAKQPRSRLDSNSSIESNNNDKYSTPKRKKVGRISQYGKKIEGNRGLLDNISEIGEDSNNGHASDGEQHNKVIERVTLKLLSPQSQRRPRSAEIIMTPSKSPKKLTEEILSPNNNMPRKKSLSKNEYIISSTNKKKNTSNEYDGKLTIELPSDSDSEFSGHDNCSDNDELNLKKDALIAPTKNEESSIDDVNIKNKKINSKINEKLNKKTNVKVTKTSDKSKINEPENPLDSLDSSWMEVSFLLKKPIKSENDLMFTSTAVDSSLLFIQQMDRTADRLQVNRGLLSRWILPFDVNTNVSGQSSTPHSVFDRMPPEFKGLINQKEVRVLVNGANTLRSLVRVKLADDNDLAQANSAVLMVQDFMTKLYDLAKQDSKSPYSLLSTIIAKCENF